MKLLVADANCPASQSVHVVAPGEAAKRPTEQLWQRPWPVVLVKLP